MEENEETAEVIKVLTNDEYCYNTLLDEDDETIEEFVRLGNAPDYLYEWFDSPPASWFDDVDWKAVAKALEDK